jgi:hypothetical protein
MRPWTAARSMLDTQVDTALTRDFASPSFTSPVSRRKQMVPGLGVEPRWPCGQGILRPREKGSEYRT